MIQPNELKSELPMGIANGVISSTSKVWNILVASKNGDLAAVKKLLEECPELIYAQYNYTPPVHFAVREGHTSLVRFLLQEGALDPAYVMYPFRDTLLTIAKDRGHDEITELLQNYLSNPGLCRYKGDNGEIYYQRSKSAEEFEQAVYEGDVEKTERILKDHPEFALDKTYFWGEGILTFAAKKNDRRMIDLLMDYGAAVPDVLKWTQAYYFEHDEGAEYMMKKGMNPNIMSWHHVTILHDMAQKGNIKKAELLLSYGADLDPIEEEYQSTPIGLAARWGQTAMVEYLLSKGADHDKAGASWARPLNWARAKNHKEIEKLLADAGAL